MKNPISKHTENTQGIITYRRVPVFLFKSCILIGSGFFFYFQNTVNSYDERIAEVEVNIDRVLNAGKQSENITSQTNLAANMQYLDTEFDYLSDLNKTRDKIRIVQGVVISEIAFSAGNLYANFAIRCINRYSSRREEG